MSELCPARVVELANGVDERLGRQIEFVLELDQLKTVIRRSLLIDGSRYENTAEHSWHLAMLALVLADRAHSDVDLVRAVKIVLIHDIVEIDAGDVYIYDEVGRANKAAQEAEAADRIFGLLPPEAAAEMRALWDEYEERRTPTAKFAYAIDRLQPLLLNAAAGGRAWLENGIRESQVRTINGPIAGGSEQLWLLASAIIDEAVTVGALKPE